MTVYGSLLCRDCMEFKENLDHYKIPYVYIDINESLKNLKEFLHYRDNHPDIFESIKAQGGIGIPCIIDDGNVTLDWKNLLKTKGFTPLNEEKKNTCSIDGKGC